MWLSSSRRRTDDDEAVACLLVRGGTAGRQPFPSPRVGGAPNGCAGSNWSPPAANPSPSPSPFTPAPLLSSSSFFFFCCSLELASRSSWRSA